MFAYAALMNSVVAFLWLAGRRLENKNKKLTAELKKEKERGEFNRSVHNKQLKILLNQAVERRKQLVRMKIRE